MDVFLNVRLTKLKKRPQILVLAKYFGDFIPSPRNSPLCSTKLKKRPFGRFLKFWCEQRGSNPRPQPWQGCALAN